ncbi:MAG: inositol monophosphatase family protein [Acidobacteriota bacterium]
MKMASIQGPAAGRQEILPLLKRLHHESQAHLDRLRSEVVSGTTVGVNAKGDPQRHFDVAVDQWVRRWLTEHYDGGIVVSEEETEVLEFGNEQDGYRFVVDPVDGSDNYVRGLPLSALSVAVLPREAPLRADRVVYGLVGDVYDGDPFVAAREQGAYRSGQRLRTSRTHCLRDSVLSCELNHWAPDGSLARTLEGCAGVRAYGCASRALCLVAVGALDAHIDVRSRLTPESFLAASLMVTEAGGHVRRLDGAALGPFRSLQDRTTLVAASTRELAEEIIDAIAR